jgi:hypothetical protein
MEDATSVQVPEAERSPVPCGPSGFDASRRGHGEDHGMHEEEFCAPKVKRLPDAHNAIG